MRLVFAGTPDPAVASLRALAGTDHEIACVVTRRDAPVGRKRVLTASPVAAAAAELGIDVLKTDRLDAEATEHISALAPDLGVIVAYGGLVREPLLSTPRLGWINLHFSLLPRWRGAAPVQRALIAGDSETGTNVFQLTAGLDEGDVYGGTRYRIPATATAGRVLEDLARDGATALVEVVDQLAAGTARALPQAGESTYAGKLTAEDGRLDWTQPADAVLSRFRGTTPEPGAFTTVDGVRVKIHDMHRADGAATLAPGAIRAVRSEVLIGTATEPVALVRVQPAGKAAMAAGDWLRGLRAADGLVAS
ncbi:methionyl-tRNA formyltransferase [Microbacterium sp. CIAB417]|uniref:methionyl-tRNA formyltransferase n=1 Tax=Microbacterium sp. CIAB417 TaxID=2860287 RepID=UPI001FAE3AAE|nr:methionyl-tRNA formyltransferase [Microbacterium sp. CIAB417]